ncbi:MAG TPA: hypothetical protein VF519_08655 [Mycobacteriales bacterium]|jgi:hypothetical protein
MKFRTLGRVATTVAAATLCVAGVAAGPAAAATRLPAVNVDDVLMLPGVGLAAATAEVNILNAQLALDAAKQSPNSSCALPAVAGYGTPGYDANLVMVRSADTVEAQGECVNLTGAEVRTYLTVEVFYRDAPGSFASTGCANTYQAPVATNGASTATTAPPLLCVHSNPAVFGREHVALATVWSSAGGYAQQWSQPWQG